MKAFNWRARAAAIMLVGAFLLVGSYFIASGSKSAANAKESASIDIDTLFSQVYPTVVSLDLVESTEKYKIGKCDKRPSRLDIFPYGADTVAMFVLPDGERVYFKVIGVDPTSTSVLICQDKEGKPVWLNRVSPNGPDDEMLFVEFFDNDGFLFNAKNECPTLPDRLTDSTDRLTDKP